MKKITLALTISALIALVLGVGIFVVEAFINPGVYTFAGFFMDSWGQIYSWFSFLTNPDWGDLLRIVMLSAIGVFGLVIPIIWIVLMVKYNKPKSALVLVSWYLILAVSVFDTAFLIGSPNFLAVVLAPSDILTSILLWATHGFIALALILVLVAGIINMVYCANAPTPPKRTFSNASGSDERLVLIREEPQPNAPSADEIREVLHDELESAPVPAEKPEQAQSPVHTVNTQPGISGPLLVQYINTYGPQAQPQAAPAPQQNLYPPYPFLAACPCARGNFVPCMQAGYCPCMKDGKFPCLEQHSVSEPKPEPKPEPVPAPVVEPSPAPAVVAPAVAPAASGGYDVVKEEPAKSEAVDVEKIKEIMHGELGLVQPIEKPLVKEEPKAPAPSVVQVGPSLEEIRAMVRQELKVEEKEEKPAPIIVAVPAPLPAKSEPVSEPLSEDKIRGLIADELAKLIVKKEPEPMPEPEAEHVSEDSIRAIIADELAKVVAKPEPAPVETVKPVTSDEMRRIMAEMVDRLVAVKPEPAPVVAPAPVVTPEPKPAPAPVKVAPPVVAPKAKPAQKEEEDSEEKVSYVRIPFRTRIQSADKEMKMNFNELKSEIMSYGVKSRISNSGDTFRLHTKTYVKITIAGKSLKLYFALDPKDYEKTTLPVQDAGHKGIYKEIPLVFKVKSELSLRRAKQLIADVMEKNGLEQGKVELHNWVKEIKD